MIPRVITGASAGATLSIGQSETVVLAVVLATTLLNVLIGWWNDRVR